MTKPRGPSPLCVLNYMHMHFGYLQIRVKHAFNVLCSCATVHTRVVLQAYDIVEQLLYVCYRLFVVGGLCYCAVVWHVCLLCVFVCVLSVYTHTKICQLCRVLIRNTANSNALLPPSHLLRPHTVSQSAHLSLPQQIETSQFPIHHLLVV